MDIGDFCTFEFLEEEYIKVDGLLINYPQSYPINLPAEKCQNKQVHFIKDDFANSNGTVALLHLGLNLGYIKNVNPLESYKELNDCFGSSLEIGTEMYYVAVVIVDGDVLWMDGKLDGQILLARNVEGSDVIRVLNEVIPPIFGITDDDPGPESLTMFYASCHQIDD